MTTFFEKDWGFMAGEISRYKFDLLPRVTWCAIPHVDEISIGFLCLHLQLTIWSREVREFNRRNNGTLR